MSSSDSPRIVIVGAGLAGIMAATLLKKRLGFTNYTMYEKEANLGGTWLTNTYPGCGSDVPGHYYSFSEELNPNWNSVYIEQPEIRAYWQSIYDKYKLAKHTEFNTAVGNAVWDEKRQLYTISLHRLDTKQTETIEAEIVIWAIGGFLNPNIPVDLAGPFKGDVFHSARWKHDVPLAGRRIGVIGNGCSAAQFIPQIAKDQSSTIINFCRTPQWFAPRFQAKYPVAVKFAFAHVPFLMRFYRWALFLRSDIGFIIFRQNSQRIGRFLRKQLTKYIAHKVPEKYMAKLVPEYRVGCKRFIVDPGYLQSLQQDNVDLNWDGIEAVTETGIKTKKGEDIPLDVLIFGTGFSLEPSERDLSITGRNGLTLRDYFKSKGGGEAYLGSCMPNFPNAFTLLGPNTATGHASVIFTEECQINYVLQLIKPILDRKAKSVEVKASVADNYNKWIQDRINTSVWTTCMSYYRSGADGKNIAMFPGPVSLFYYFTRRPVWSEYITVGADKFHAQRRRSKAVKILSALTFVALIGGAQFGLYDPQVVADAVTSQIPPQTQELIQNTVSQGLSFVRSLWSR